MKKYLAFADEEFDGQFGRTLQAATIGAADLGEAFATARDIGDKYDTQRWYDQWLARAESVRDAAERAYVGGHLVTAHESYLRASEYYRQAYFYLRTDLDDQRLQDAYQAHCRTFRHAMELLPRTSSPIVAEEVTIPVAADSPAGPAPVGPAPVTADTADTADPTESAATTETTTTGTPHPTAIHAWLFRPDSNTDRARPTIVMPCGYDSTAESGWGFAQGALARGFNVLSVEGPGQGASLIVDRIYFRRDYEVVLSQILDWLESAPGVDGARLVAMGRSFAGYLVPRGVAVDHRVAAMVCDPAQPDMGAKIPGGWKGRIAAPLMTALSKISRERDDFFRARMACHGVDTIADYFAELATFTFTDIAADIACPTLIVESPGDPVGGQGQTLFDALTVETKRLITPDPDSGISGHCGGVGQRVWDAVVYDWLEDTLARITDPTAPAREPATK